MATSADYGKVIGGMQGLLGQLGGGKKRPPAPGQKKRELLMLDEIRKQAGGQFKKPGWNKLPPWNIGRPHPLPPGKKPPGMKLPGPGPGWGKKPPIKLPGWPIRKPYRPGPIFIGGPGAKK